MSIPLFLTLLFTPPADPCHEIVDTSAGWRAVACDVSTDTSPYDHDLEISWCYEDAKGNVSCGATEQPIGCQYFPEEAGDDIVVCVLSTLANLCCECLSVCPSEDEE